MNDAFSDPMTVAAAADRFEAARRDARNVGPLFRQLTPQDIDDGYLIQAELARRAGAVGGWKVSYLTPESQAAKGVNRPMAGRLLGPYCHASPAQIRFNFIAPVLECEFAFELGRDLPQRKAPYTRAEVEDAIAAMRPAIEIVDPRLNRAAMPMALADCISNGGFVYGPPTADWRTIDYPAAAITLAVNGSVEASGTGQSILGGDPVGAVVMLANHQPPECEGLKRGQMITTGSCTGTTPVSQGDQVVGDFGAYGRVEATFVS